MTHAEVFRGLEAVVQKHFPSHGPVRQNEKFRDEIATDSLAQLTLVVELENYFDVMLEEDFAKDLETVEQLVSALALKINQA